MEHEEKKFMEERISIVIDMIKSFVFAGLELTMTSFNKIGKVTYSGKRQPSYPQAGLTLGLYLYFSSKLILN